MNYTLVNNLLVRLWIGSFSVSAQISGQSFTFIDILIDIHTHNGSTGFLQEWGCYILITFVTFRPE